MKNIAMIVSGMTCGHNTPQPVPFRNIEALGLTGCDQVEDKIMG
jgi:hypothetical protein